MNLKPTTGQVLALALAALCGWVLHGFLEALMAAGVTAVASWPLYERLRARLPRWIGSGAAALLFTGAITSVVLAPLALAGAALLGEVHALMRGIAGADGRGLPAPQWLLELPWFGPWLQLRWQVRIADPGALHTLAHHADPSTLFGWARSLSEFTARQALTVAFAVLLLAFFYRHGDALARELMRTMGRVLGDRAPHFVGVATRAVRASVGSMIAVAAFDTVAVGLVYALAGAPRALIWAAITGTLAAVPFLGYAAVAALVLQMSMSDTAAPALLSLVLGCGVLLVGDKVVRPMAARGGVRLPFVWTLMGCIGGFGVLGAAGLVIGPVALALAREVWEHRGHEATATGRTAPAECRSDAAASAATSTTQAPLSSRLSPASPP
jgi:predicted PurR-regulated permease PerM